MPSSALCGLLLPSTSLYVIISPTMEKLLKSRFRINEKLSENAFTITYKGTTLEKELPIIIKIYKHATLNSSLIKDMKQKVRRLTQIDHPNIARLIDGDYGWQGFYYVREYINAKSLAEIIGKNSPLNEELAVKIALGICDGLEAVHSLGLLHGALSPGNIFMTSENQIILTDFTIEGEIKNSIPEKIEFIRKQSAYMSPEEINGQGLQRSSDIYSLGLILYEMVAATNPFKPQAAEDSLSMANKKMRQLPLPARGVNNKISEGLNAVIMNTLSLDPLMRLPNIQALKDSLKSLSVIMPGKHFDLPAINYDNSPAGIAPKEIIKKSSELIREIEKKGHYQSGNWLVRLVIIGTLAGILYAIISTLLKF